jgi:hypothetical protein
VRSVLFFALIPALALVACGGSAAPARTVTPAVTASRTPTAPPATQTPAATASAVPTGAAAGTPSATSTGGNETGIEGIVLLGPTCPVQRVDSPCPDRPYVATLDVVDAASGAIVITVTSGADGRFRVQLSPGAYRLVPRNTGTLPRGAEQTATVVGGQVTTVQVTYDTGIR